MASDDVDALDDASLDKFRVDLIKAGFEPVTPGSQRRWRGLIAEPLAPLTTSTEMEIAIQDGWPHKPPKLFIMSKDLVSEHVAADGEICLWRPDDASYAWITLEGFQHRIAEWCEQRIVGFRPEDAMLDAHLYFRGPNAGLATLDITSLGIDRRDPAGATNTIYGQWNKKQSVLELSVTRPEGKAIGGRWYYHARALAAPPRDLSAFRAALTRGQQINLERRLRNVRASGSPYVAALLWTTPHGTNGLVLYLTRDSTGDVHAESLELAPSDTETLRLRCGPDAGLLQTKHVTIFGAGSIGSHVALQLAEAGLGRLHLVDGDTMRPGNTVRHAAVLSVGENKARATRVRILLSAPWTEASTTKENPWSPTRIRALMNGSDLVIDATGLSRFTILASQIADRHQRLFVSAALYRGGAIARVRRQAPDRDVPIFERTDETRYPLIPPGDERLALEPGCNAPVNNASPVAVVAIAALTSEIAIDSLAGRWRYDEETIDVYRSIDAAPFDRLGRLAPDA